MRRFGKQPFAWNDNAGAVLMKNMTSDNTHGQNTVEEEQSQNGTNGGSLQNNRPQTCRNSVQGRTLIADDQGT